MNLEQGIWVGLVTGVIGAGYFVYGKKQGSPVPLIAGILLMVYPYFIDSLLISICIGIGLVVAPFIIKIDV